MQVKSKYLGKEFEVDVFEAMEDGETVSVISHETLESIIYNQIDASMGVTCEYKALLISPEHSVFFCTIKDATGRIVQQVGEVTPATLETEIAKNFPVLTAAKRAFDRAAKLYLNLEIGGKVLSDAEADLSSGASNNGTEVVDINKEAEKASRMAQDGREPAKGTDTTSSKKNAPAAPVGRTEGIATQKPSGGAATNPGDVICDVAIFRGRNMTVAQAYKENPKYVGWIATKYSGTTPEQIAIKKACVDFLETIKEA